MSELKIPNEVLDSIYQAIDEQIGWTAHAERAIDIAAPLIVAAELRRQAIQLHESAKYQDGAGEHNGLQFAAYRLEDRADDLDPQGVTK